MSNELESNGNGDANANEEYKVGRGRPPVDCR